jgi:hypothetical protein
MKTKLTLLLFLFITIITYSQKVEHSETVYYGEFFPPEISNIGFGLTAETFNNFMTSNSIVYNSNDSKTTFVISVSDKLYTSVFYKFDLNLKVLLELELRFANEQDAKTYMKAHFKTSDEFRLKKETAPYYCNAWHFKNKVFFVGKIPGSKWSN